MRIYFVISIFFKIEFFLVSFRCTWLTNCAHQKMWSFPLHFISDFMIRDEGIVACCALRDIFSSINTALGGHLAFWSFEGFFTCYLINFGGADDL